jgi:uncharacterized protein YndB with AHSA1/START domain
MLKKIGIGVVVLLAALFGFAATRPDTFRVERTVKIDAPPAEIFALISDFHGWSAWSPYEQLDPAMKRSYSGSASGMGAVYEWNSDGKAGAGRMEITEATLSRITIQLDFTRPFESHNIAEFTLEPQGEATSVTWAMHGPNLYLGKVMSIFFDMDRMIGADFETGLANLKAIAEE